MSGVGVLKECRLKVIKETIVMVENKSGILATSLINKFEAEFYCGGESSTTATEFILLRLSFARDCAVAPGES